MSYETEERRRVPRRRKQTGRWILTILFSALIGGLVGAGVLIMGLGQSSSQESLEALPQRQVVQVDPEGNMAVADIADDVVPTVVGITNYGRLSPFLGGGQAALGSGSGVIVESAGTIVTNFHVIANAERLVVTLNDGSEHDAKVLGFDEPTDIALLKIDAKNLPAIKLGDSDALRVGSPVVAVGNPLGVEFSQTVTDGIISGTNRKLEGEGQAFGLLQTNAAINSGNSGGALVDGQARLIGINSAKIAATGVEGIGFAIPINEVMKVVEQLKENGQVERPYIGITGYSLTPDFAAQMDVFVPDQGLLIAQVMPQSPAGEAGLSQGDIIVEAEGQTIASFEDMSNILKEKAPGDKVQLKILREGKEVQTELILGSQSSALQ